jgi:hypothetical protein
MCAEIRVGMGVIVMLSDGHNGNLESERSVRYKDINNNKSIINCSSHWLSREIVLNSVTIMTGFGVLFQLQLRGLLCPCLQRNGEDSNARQAVTTLNRSCRHVQVHATKQASASSSSSSSGSIGFLGNLFSSSGSSSNSASGASSLSSRDQHPPYLAKLVLRDSTVDGQPEIVIDGLDRNRQNDLSEKCALSRTIKLRRIDKVVLEGDEIVFKSKSVAASSSKSHRPSQELLRFVVLQQPLANDDDDDIANDDTTPSVLPVTADTRNLLVHHFMVLTEWERQRRAALVKSDPDSYNVDNDSEDDDDDDDDGNVSGSRGGTNFITARAQKMADYAQREIELQRTKAKREQRKAQLLKEAGGLKYTAMAMANMPTTASPSKSPPVLS